MRFKQIKYVFFALICMCVTPLITHAECDYQRQAELSRLASNVQFSYNYDSNMNFTINITNVTDDIYVSYLNPSTLSYESLYGAGEKNIQVVSGTSLKFVIYSNDHNCPGEELMTKYITTPNYNVFSNYDECKQYPNFKYCQVWLSTSITHEQFQSEFNNYTKSVESNKKSQVDKSAFWDEIVTFFEDNTPILIFGAVLIGILIITIIVVKLLRRKH